MVAKECGRCGNESLADYDCADCGENAAFLSDEMHRIDDSGRLYEADADGGFSQVFCSACGKEVFEVSYHEYCSWCQHQVDKGN
jgi:ribosomal protein L37E